MPCRWFTDYRCATHRPHATGPATILSDITTIFEFWIISSFQKISNLGSSFPSWYRYLQSTALLWSTIPPLTSSEVFPTPFSHWDCSRQSNCIVARVWLTLELISWCNFLAEVLVPYCFPRLFIRVGNFLHLYWRIAMSDTFLTLRYI